jgi:hypothetical protein
MATGLFESIKDKYKDSVDMRKRIYGESLLKSFTGSTSSPITLQDFSKKELASLENLIKEHHKEKVAYFSRPKKELLRDATMLENKAKENLEYVRTLSPDQKDLIDKYNQKVQLSLTQANQLKEAALGKIPTDFSFQYTGYGDRQAENTFTKDPTGWAQVLGRFRYTVDPQTNTYNIYDTYDFNNKVHKQAAENYAKMNPVDRFSSVVSNTLLNGDQYAAGEAYLSGVNAVPVNINLTGLEPTIK